MKPHVSVDHSRANPASGLRCPACGAQKSRVVNGNPGTVGSLGVNARRRCCASCGHRFGTVEMPANQLGALFGVVTAEVKATLRRRLSSLQSNLLNSL